MLVTIRAVRRDTIGSDIQKAHCLFLRAFLVFARGNHECQEPLRDISSLAH